MCSRCGFVQRTPGVAGRGRPAKSSTTDSGGHTATNKRGTVCNLEAVGRGLPSRPWPAFCDTRCSCSLAAWRAWALWSAAAATANRCRPGWTERLRRRCRQLALRRMMPCSQTTVRCRRRWSRERRRRLPTRRGAARLCRNLAATTRAVMPVRRSTTKMPGTRPTTAPTIVTATMTMQRSTRRASPPLQAAALSRRMLPSPATATPQRSGH